MSRFLNAYVALERMAMEADADDDPSFSEVARDSLDAFWSGMSDDERAEMKARILAACCQCASPMLVPPPNGLSAMMSWSYSCAACSTRNGLPVPDCGHRASASGAIRRSITGRSEAAEEIRDAIEHGTACLFCGAEKAPGTDYCDACKDSERREMEELTTRRSPP